MFLFHNLNSASALLLIVAVGVGRASYDGARSLGADYAQCQAARLDEGANGTRGTRRGNRPRSFDLVSGAAGVAGGRGCGCEVRPLDRDYFQRGTDRVRALDRLFR